MTRRSERRLTRLRTDEAGFALIEVMVSAVLVIVLATATLSVIDRTGAAASANRQRGEAVTLAQADQDTVRLTPVADLADYHKTYSSKVGETTFAIQSDVVWLQDASGEITCAAGARTDYAKVTSKVTWPGHPTPVVLESYISPGVKGIARAGLTVKLHTDAGVGTSGIVVNYLGRMVTTDAGGCAVFTDTPAGAADATWTGAAAPPYVNEDGESSVTESVTTAAGQVAQVDSLFDRAGSIPANFINEYGQAVKWKSLTVLNSGIQDPPAASGGSGWRRFTQAGYSTQITASTLFPFIAPYSLVAGSCTGSSPTTWYPSATTTTKVAPQGSTSAATSVLLPSVIVYTTSDGTINGAQVPSVKLSFTPYSAQLSGAITSLNASNQPTAAPSATSIAKMAGCSDAITVADGIATYNNPVQAGAPSGAVPGSLLMNLPYGLWNVCAQTGTGASAKRTRYPFILKNTPRSTTTGGEQQDRMLVDANYPPGLTAATSTAIPVGGTRNPLDNGTCP